MTQKARKHIDIHLLRVLHTLLQCQSVSRTAIRLDMSQPAVSNALRRLRDITQDPILLRARHGMVATERGQSLLEHAELALKAIEQIETLPQAFDPLLSTRHFHLGAPDYLDASFIPEITECIVRQAPQAKLIVHPLGPGLDYEQALESGQLDIVIANWPEPPPRLHMGRLFDDEIVCLVGNQHPLAERGLSLKHYAQLQHLVPSLHAQGQQSIIDQVLAEHGIHRQAQVSVPYFGLVPYILMRTDLVFTTSRQFAEHYARFMPLRVLAPPLDFPKMSFYQLWHPRTHGAQACVWFRRLVNSVALSLQARGE